MSSEKTMTAKELQDIEPKIQHYDDYRKIPYLKEVTHFFERDGISFTVKTATGDFEDIAGKTDFLSGAITTSGHLPFKIISDYSELAKEIGEAEAKAIADRVTNEMFKQ